MKIFLENVGGRENKINYIFFWMSKVTPVYGILIHNVIAALCVLYKYVYIFQTFLLLFFLQSFPISCKYMSVPYLIQ